ncbi:MAG: polysaccharide biosynthesis protein [Burkholderiales bacterium]|nr:polysaccharide biosynthesis protein [Burkholderiales bacterium]
MNTESRHSYLYHFALLLSRPVKRLIVFGVDVFLCIFSVWIAFYLRLEQWDAMQGARLWAVAGAVAIAIPLLMIFGLYRAIFRYTGWNTILRLMQAMFLYGVIYAVIFTFIGVSDIPRTVGIIQPLILFLLISLCRLAVRYWLGGMHHFALKQKNLPGVLVYGAGSAGRQLAAALIRGNEYRLIGYLDDDKNLHGHDLDGRKVYAPTALKQLTHELDVTDVLLALPSVSHERRLEILENLRSLPLHVRTLPGMADLASGKVSLNDIRELDIEDLLGREAVSPDKQLLSKNIFNKIVLVTGAGGSIGSELCRQIIELRPRSILLLESNEFSLYKIHRELEFETLRSIKHQDASTQSVEIVPLLGSVCDEFRVAQIMRTWHPNTVYHAAAYKHVPLVEHNVAEGLRNNAIGTLVCAKNALAHGVENFVLISTDKAVRPTNVMGASKRLAEMALQALSKTEKSFEKESATKEKLGCKTCFSMVRFGNVLGSSGSVVPLFREQIKNGGPITLTHPDITRYFMTIPEAAQLVIQAGAMGKGGDVFVLDMGKPVRIYDLACRMIELSGHTLKQNNYSGAGISIEVSGLRPGEKLYEELLIGDNPTLTHHPRIMKADEDYLPWDEFELKMMAMNKLLGENDVPAIKKLLEELVQGYQPAQDVVDWVYSEKRI